MSWTVAIGAVSIGVVMGTGPATADDGPSDTAERDANGTAVSGNPDPRRIERTSPDAKAAARGAWQRPDSPEGATLGDPDTDHHPGWDCHWPDWNPVFTPTGGIGGGIVGGGGGGGLILVGPATVAAPLIASPPVSGPATGRTLTGLTPVEPEAVAPPAPAIAPLGGPLPPSPAPPGPPVQAPPPPAAPPVAPASPTAAPQPAAAQANPLRLGYPDYLQSAGVEEIAALAILGSAGLVALAGAGGVVGYRQAKTGFALRAAGTARFLS